jgi:beta-mannosidase
VATTPVRLVPVSNQPDPNVRRETILVAELWHDGVLAARSVTTFGPDKQLLLGRPNVEWSLAAETGGSVGGGAAGGRRVVAHLRSDTLARWAELALDGADAIFDDNYVDLPAGRDVAIGFELPDGWTLDRAREALRIRSVIDTYA